MATPDDSARNRFPRQARLTRPGEYQRVFSGAKRYGDKYFTVLAAHNDRGYPRLGMAVARRAIPRAVGRNRIKRQVRESFRHIQGELGSWDLVVLAKASARDASNECLQRSLARVWQRLKR
ncbi:ribonuclease P protein component [Alkalilimnicola ehrlichii]|uniref:Ribonuclease P protein component n=1 Tax=Alkalilimnicola ehrlichii TaxID=351052 RepID=A0A3E0X1M0_9GAMM|nr:ribonuclease P protein component [Alkalilimnicola ehrlichii]RFA38232.1 ribonuclease P protein component [Alkalilimnicola ehrlichii]